VQDLVAGCDEFVRRGLDSVGIGDVELETGLRDGPIGGPCRRPEASLRRLVQRPDAEVLAARELLDL
jgi:hypothetical protein